MKTTDRRIAYIFEDVGGWFICDADSEMLDARGHRYDSKNQAIASLREQAKRGHTEYTHYQTGKTKPRRLV